MDEKGSCKILPENVEVFSNEINDLVKTEVEINANKIKIEDLESLDFTPGDMAVLETFIDFGEE